LKLNYLDCKSTNQFIDIYTQCIDQKRRAEIRKYAVLI
jgi:hypothetical protein